MKNYRILAGVFIAAALIFIGHSLPRKDSSSPLGNIKDLVKNQQEQDKEKQVEVKKFASKEEFLAYLESAQSSEGFGYGRGESLFAAPMAERGMAMEDRAQGLNESSGSAKSTAPAPADRSSQTNVQVKGIDEPDIVKTNGSEIFVSTPNYYIYNQPLIKAMPESMPVEGDLRILPPQNPVSETKVINALPADKIKQIGKLPRQGEMLLMGENLIIFENNYVYGFDISKPESPEEKWQIRLENSFLSSARLMDGKIYLVTQSYLDYGNPCPIKPLYVGERAIEIACTDIYHPIVPVGDTSTYHVFRINPSSGEVEKSLSFVGSSGQSVVYMSGESLYISYVYNEDQVKVLADFLKQNGQGLLPQNVIDRINRLLSYDISSSAKQLELSNILQKHYASLNQDDKRKLENEMENKLSGYLKAHMRDLTSTGLVKITLPDFGVKATGHVSGMPLNQFSLDEFKGHLRIATTISSQGTIWGGWRNDASANDVYVLDNDLDVVGSIKDLGLTERIYSARFVGERGFLVTFRQTDPFYILDLSDPKAPKKAGELKIPGFSSYLHPLKDDLVLGVGQENGRVKLSLFDVSNSADPKEIDKYTLDEYWSEAQNNHHAFLQDEKYEAFFLPGGQTGYVFSYAGDKLSLKKAVGRVQAQRALYVKDFLYVVGSDRIVVLNEKNWERVGELVY
ncbi:MAG: beta-propeller domain-containing protein [Candidatus Doudnabacteria bacterium]|nr:beta-propeller domain-containing protein [Candidatus Doudnabacteria bacterium]